MYTIVQFTKFISSPQHKWVCRFQLTYNIAILLLRFYGSGWEPKQFELYMLILYLISINRKNINLVSVYFKKENINDKKRYKLYTKRKLIKWQITIFITIEFPQTRGVSTVVHEKSEQKLKYYIVLNCSKPVILCCRP